MSKKKYTKKMEKFVTNLVVNENYKVTPATKKMCEHFEISYNENVGRLFRKKLQNKGITHNFRRIEDSDEFKKASKKKFDKKRDVFIFTWAQSDTDIHENFFNGVEAYAKDRKAGLHVIAGRYKNPTSLSSSKRLEDEEKRKSLWHKRVLPYLDANRHNIHPLLQVLSDVKIQPTAATPLSGMNSITGLESCIIGHPRVHLDPLPVLDGYPSKLLLTTGSCTVKNYTDTKAGKKGEFHHQLGFVVVELDGDDFHVRQVTADKEGNFYDLDRKVVDGEVFYNDEGASVVVLGDIHNMSTDKVAMKVSKRMLDFFRPDHTMVHDVFDGYSINPHEHKSPFELLRKEQEGVSLKYEIKSMLKWLKKYKKYNLVVVRSNHDEFFDRFLNEDWRKQQNKFEFLKYAHEVAKGNTPRGVIPYIIDKEFKGEVRALGIDESYRVLDHELSIHGHVGASGSRGSATQFKKLNTKTVTGHTHTPRRFDGHLSAGTLTKMKLGYNRGMSSWMHTNVVIYPNGEPQHIHIIKGKFHKND